MPVNKFVGAICDIILLFSLFLHVSPLSCCDRKLRAFLLFPAHLESSKSVQKRRSYNCLKVRHIFVSLSNNGCDVTMKSASELRTL